MPKKKKNKKKWMRGVFGTFQNPSQYDGWNGDAGTMSQSKELFNDNIRYATGPMKKWYKYQSIKQLYDHYIANSQPDGYL